MNGATPIETPFSYPGALFVLSAQYGTVHHLKIHLERTARLLLIRISDDGVGMDEQTLARMNGQLQKSARTVAAQEAQDAKARGGIALCNVNNRIHLLFGEEYGLRVFSVPGVGTDVEILLPAITSDRDVPNKEALRSL